MISSLNKLNGLTVSKVVEIHDYVQLHFGSDIGISIYNDIEVKPPSAALSAFVGKSIDAVVESENAIELRFRDGMQILIDLRPIAYHGPEALVLNQRGHPTVIWR